MAEVQRVLVEIGASAIPQVLVFNKLDRLEETQRPRALRDRFEVSAGMRVPRVFISASTGEGMPALRDILREAVAGTLEGILNSTEPAPHDERWVDDPKPASAADDIISDDASTEPQRPGIHLSLARP